MIVWLRRLFSRPALRAPISDPRNWQRAEYPRAANPFFQR